MQKIYLQEGFILREYAGEFCIFEAARANEGAVEGIPSLNPDGIFLWNLIESGVVTLHELSERLAAHNDLSIEDAELDVQEFLARLMLAKILTYR